MTELSILSVQRSFLDLSNTSPRWDRVFQAIAWIVVAIFPLALWRYDLWVRSSSVLFVLIWLLVIGLSLIQWLRGYKEAGYLALGYGTFWFAEALRQISNFGWVDLPFTKNISMTWALLLSAPMFFFALIENSRRLGSQLREVQQINKTKSEFLARVSHELHAPLNTIIGYARMLRRRSPRLSLQEGTTDIERNGVRLLAMLDELLDQSRIEAGHLVLQPQPVALHSWLDELERAGVVMSESFGNVFVLERRGEMPAGVLLDAPRLRQVLDNLVSNANRHTHKGRIVLRCEVSPASVADKAMLSFSVRDNGEGIAEADQKRVFEAFYQGRGGDGHSHGGSRQGLGLGLSIAEHLVSKMGGKLALVSQPGIGSTFSFGFECLRVVPPADPAVPVASDPAEASETVIPMGLRILVVDDDPSALKALVDLSESLGCVADMAGSGQQAIAQLMREPHRWDLVVTDQVMDDGDGWSVLRHVRQHCPGLRVVLVSGVSAQRPDGMPADMDFDAFCRKPVEPSALADVVAAMRSRPSELARPDEHQLADLLALVRLGEVSAIEDWCARLEREQPALRPFALQVKRAAQQIDFASLEQLAAA